MFLTDDNAVVYTSASDLSSASKCEFAFLRGLDARLGRVKAVEAQPDPMLERTGKLGNEHEERVLARYRTESTVVEISRPNARDTNELDAAAAATKSAFESGAPIVFQATFHERSEPVDGVEIAFLGYADFIVRTETGAYKVQDTKLARSARVTALLQLAAYAEQLEKLGIPTADTVELLLGDGSVSEHRLSDIAPVFRNRRDRLHRIIREHMAQSDAVAWGDLRYTLCGHCDDCTDEIAKQRDVLLVAGMRVTQRAALGSAGISTIDELAISTGDVDGIGAKALAGMRAQARMQLKAGEGAPPFELVDASALSAIPAPSPGDIFFDFEGDPLYTEGDATRWGLDYLFGLVDTAGEFVAFWAHDFAEERVALRAFLDHGAVVRAEHPDMHIYHYAAYERTHLTSLAARHGVGEAEVDQLLREHVLVDLYPIVRKAIRVGSPSYSIKKLEPLYMGTELRESKVKDAAASIDEYVNAVSLKEQGDAAGAQAKLAEIADYNRYDCVSTLRLRDWLRSFPSPPVEPAEPLEGVELVETPLHEALMAMAGDPLNPNRSDDETAAAFAAAALDYHRREAKTFWWGHFSRLIQPIEEWAETRDVLVVESAQVVREWSRVGKEKSDHRHLRLTGSWAPGSSVKPGGIATPFLLYEAPTPFDDPRADPGARATRNAKVIGVYSDGVLVDETLAAGLQHYDMLPVAVTPAAPPRALEQKPAIEEWAAAIVDEPWPSDPASDILRRVPPRGVLSPAIDEDYVSAVTSAALSLDHSYLAVQGPPGTGKTYLGAHVITSLVRDHQWKIGVVAQSHAVIENLLDAVVEAGLDPRLIGKDMKKSSKPIAYISLPENGQLDFAQTNSSTGFVVGGTAWDFANKARVPRASLDLLVIDEAGQFSLAATIAASVSARNLLLLGDPQQLPQVSQGLHPEPIDGSALGFISAGHDVLPDELGYFLAASRRMHPRVTEPVSVLSYEGELHSHTSASLRHLDRVEPGLHIVPVASEGNSVESREEADRVLQLVQQHLGLSWTDDITRPLTEADIIVVTPYNAQVGLVRETLDSAGLTGVRVGTVDKFQGQEAVIPRRFQQSHPRRTHSQRRAQRRRIGRSWLYAAGNRLVRGVLGRQRGLRPRRALRAAVAGALAMDSLLADAARTLWPAPR